MKLELKNRASCLIIESLASTHFTCDVCPDSVQTQAIAVLYWDHTIFQGSKILNEVEENIEIKFCKDCKEIIAQAFRNLE